MQDYFRRLWCLLVRIFYHYLISHFFFFSLLGYWTCDCNNFRRFCFCKRKFSTLQLYISEFFRKTPPIFFHPEVKNFTKFFFLEMHIYLKETTHQSINPNRSFININYPKMIFLYNLIHSRKAWIETLMKTIDHNLKIDNINDLVGRKINWIDRKLHKGMTDTTNGEEWLLLRYFEFFF